VTDADVPAAITPRVAAGLLERYGLAPRRTAGQNFVVDPNTVARIVAAAGIGPDDTVLEIGPGLGSLTLPLARVARRVVAVEVDTGLAEVVADLTAPLGTVEVHTADALRVDLDALLGEPARLVANLPYNVATPLLFAALDAEQVTDAYVMVQREVGDRWAARPGDPLYAGVSVKVALAARAEVDLSVPRAVFLPVPNVDSVMVRVTRHADGMPRHERHRVAAVVDAAFAQRRKTLRNNLRAAWGEAGVAAIEASGLDPRARAETLGVDDFVALAAALGPAADITE
jgi:16S rRNA (adenine1518-N6/adenine1519-N6)-dimethyltransferase